jgi:putative inorganic carbon (hco3(-)) transporter
VRDLLILVAVVASLPVIVLRPFFGLLVYSWLAYMRPQDMAWGPSRSLPLSLGVAVAIVAGLVLAMGRERLVTWAPETLLMAVLAGWIGLTSYLAVFPDIAGLAYGRYWKAILIALLTTGMVRDRSRLRTLFLVIAVSIGLLAAKYGLFGLARGGTRFDHGPGGMLNDNNTFALGLNMALPLLVAVVLTERSRLLRLAAGTMALLTILTILFTFSRGGLLTLAAVGLLLIWRSKRPLLAAAVLALGLLAAVAFTSSGLQEQYLERAASIRHYQQDNSALGRLNSWRVSWLVFLDYPVFGIGPNNLEVVFYQYSPKNVPFHVAHNSYFELLAECGLPSLLLFLAMLGTAFLRLERLRRAPPVPWVGVYAGMLQASLAAFVVGSTFLNMAYFDLVYHLVALAVCLELAAAGAAEAEAASPEPAAAAPWWRQPRNPAWARDLARRPAPALGAIGARGGRR